MRKMNPAKAVLFAVPALIVMACGSGSATSEDSSGEKKADSSSAGDVGNWKIETKKVRFTKDAIDSFETIKLKVRNVSDSEDEPWLEIRAMNKAGDLVTTFDCIGQTVDAGQATTLDCTSLDDFAKVTDYEIKNAF